MTRIGYCKDFDTEAEAVAEGQKWQRIGTTKDDVRWRTWSNEDGTVRLRVTLNYGSNLYKALEDEGFKPCADPDEDQ